MCLTTETMAIAPGWYACHLQGVSQRGRKGVYKDAVIHQLLEVRGLSSLIVICVSFPFGVSQNMLILFSNKWWLVLLKLDHRRILGSLTSSPLYWPSVNFGVHFVCILDWTFYEIAYSFITIIFRSSRIILRFSEMGLKDPLWWHLHQLNLKTFLSWSLDCGAM